MFPKKNPQNRKFSAENPSALPPKSTGHGPWCCSNPRLFQSTTAWCPSFDSVLKAVALNSRVEGLRCVGPRNAKGTPTKTPMGVWEKSGEIRVKKHLIQIYSFKRGCITQGVYQKKKTKKFGLVPNLSLSPITYHKPLIKDQRFIWTHLSLKSTTFSKSKDIKVSCQCFDLLTNDLSTKWWVILLYKNNMFPLKNCDLLLIYPWFSRWVKFPPIFVPTVFCYK